MRIIEEIDKLEKIEKGCVLSIGNFDGVHLGHQKILATAKQTAAKKKTELSVMTFEPHPVALLQPEKAFGVLTPLKLKEHLLAECGVDCVIVLKDSAKLLKLSPEDFVEQFLVRNVRPSVVVEGEDFNFGTARAGSVGMLQKLGAEKGFEVSVIGARDVKLSSGQTVRVSSTMIRNLLESGQVADAAAGLGRSYRLIGQVTAGRGKGKNLGFATANMKKPRQIIPVEGVYAGLVEIGESAERVCTGNEKIPSVFSIGRAKTYSGDQPLLIEAHLLVENVGRLYDKWMAMDFVARIRDQQKFETEAELSAQIAKDCEEAKEILATEDR